MFVPLPCAWLLGNLDNVLTYNVTCYIFFFAPPLLTAGEKLSGVQLSPSNQQEMKNNVEKVLQFVASKKIRMHQTSAKG